MMYKLNHYYKWSILKDKLYISHSRQFSSNSQQHKSSNYRCLYMYCNWHDMHNINYPFDKIYFDNTNKIHLNLLKSIQHSVYNDLKIKMNNNLRLSYNLCILELYL